IDESLKDNGDGSLDEATIVNTATLHLAAAPSGKLAQPIGENAQAMQAAAGANDFAFRLSATLLQVADPNQNFLCSPYSVWLPLAALSNATIPDARPALLTALGAEGLTPEDLNAAASRQLYNLTLMGEKNPLKIVNAIFVDRTAELNPTFAQIFADEYLGSPFQVNFLSKDAVDAVNEWASEHTEGLITDVIEEFDPSTVAALVNAIYFSDGWLDQFDESNSKAGVFYAPDQEVEVMYMNRRARVPYYEDDTVQVVDLPFTMGGGLLILLPKDQDASKLLESMTAKRFTDILSGMHDGAGLLQLPRFEIQTQTMDLADALIAMGIPLFDEQTAPLTGGLLADASRTWVDQAVQKAMIKVDEKGTTAAAVTVVSVTRESMPPPFEMICDSPFAFVLHAPTVDGGEQVLFTGVVNAP
ncbi:MAG: hypothetical protein LBM60_00755, partial [Clostridium sp.]|nr:hypothetical protein [Clostridium sp.]